MKKLLLALSLCLLSPAAWAQCNGTFANDTVCGNVSGSRAPPGPLPLSSFSLSPGGLTGNVQYNNGFSGFGGYTNTQLTALIQAATSSLSGALPAWPNNTTTYFRGDGTYADFASPPPIGGTTPNAITATINKGTSYFFQTGLAAGGYWLDAAGADYGCIQNTAANTWTLGYGATLDGTCTPVISWGSGGQISGSPGFALMRPYSNQLSLPNTGAGSCWNITDPWGNPINCSGTYSQGLQEFLTAVTKNGWPAIVACDGLPYTPGNPPTWHTANQVYIEATNTVTVPAMQDGNLQFQGCVINFNVTTVPGLIFDSEGASFVDCQCVIVYNVTSPNGTSCGTELAPTTDTNDGFAGIYAGYLRITNPTAGNAEAVICINVGTGTVGGHLVMYEVNAADTTSYGILIQSPSSTTGVMTCVCVMDQVHGSTVAAISEGTGTTNQANLAFNQWFVNNIETYSGRGIDTWGQYDQWYTDLVNGGEGSMTYGIVTESGASYNMFANSHVGLASSSKKLDNGTDNAWIGPDLGITNASCSPVSVVSGIVSAC